MRIFSNHSDIITYVLLTIVLIIDIFSYLPNAISSGSIFKIILSITYIIIYIVSVMCKLIELKYKKTKR